MKLAALVLLLASCGPKAPAVAGSDHFASVGRLETVCDAALDAAAIVTLDTVVWWTSDGIRRADAMTPITLEGDGRPYPLSHWNNGVLERWSPTGDRQPALTLPLPSLEFDQVSAAPNGAFAIALAHARDSLVFSNGEPSGAFRATIVAPPGAVAWLDEDTVALGTQRGLELRDMPTGQVRARSLLPGITRLLALDSRTLLIVLDEGRTIVVLRADADELNIVEELQGPWSAVSVPSAGRVAALSSDGDLVVLGPQGIEDRTSVALRGDGLCLSADSGSILAVSRHGEDGERLVVMRTELDRDDP